MGARVTGSQRGGAGPGQGGAPRTQGQERRDVQGLKQVHLRPQETAGGEPPGRGGKKLDQAPASLKIAFTVSNPGRLRRGTREARKSDPSTGDSLGSAVAWVSLLGMPQHHGPRGCGVEVPEIQMTAGRAPPGLLPVVGGWPPPPHPLTRSLLCPVRLWAHLGGGGEDSSPVGSCPPRRKTGSGPPRWPHLAFTSCLKRLIAKYNHTASY